MLVFNRDQTVPKLTQWGGHAIFLNLYFFYSNIRSILIISVAGFNTQTVMMNYNNGIFHFLRLYLMYCFFFICKKKITPNSFELKSPFLSLVKPNII